MAPAAPPGWPRRAPRHARPCPRAARDRQRAARHAAAAALAVPFIWDPARAAPALAGAAFTADTISFTGYVRDDGIVSNRIEVITGFGLNGSSTFKAPGLGSTYGLYFEAVDK